MLRRLLHHARRRRRYSSSSSSSAAGVVPLSTPTFAVFGANTGVGKTLVSAGLSAALLSSPTTSAVDYLKPLQTGYPADSDARFVFTRAPALLRANPSFPPRHPPRRLLPHPVPVPRRGSGPGPQREPGGRREMRRGRGGGNQGARVQDGVRVEGACVAAPGSGEGGDVRDGPGGQGFRGAVAGGRRVGAGGGVEGAGDGRRGGQPWPVWHAAVRPIPVRAPFRLPAILVGDGRLGGISSTLSAYETLLLRGYDVGAVILEDRALSNDKFLLSYLEKRVCVLVLPQIPEDPSDDLTDWFSESSLAFGLLKNALQSFHSKRIQRLSSMQRKSKELLWWPFTQHDLVPVESVTVIDSRCGENFSAYKIKDSTMMLVPQFDACASWWTQGPDSSLQIELARDMGYAAARYGHVMFPENVHEPALCCAELLLGGVGKGWASRVYYSDSGSTAIEIALKMAFRKFCDDHGIQMDNEKSIRNIQLKVFYPNTGHHCLQRLISSAELKLLIAGEAFHITVGRGLFVDPPTVYVKNDTCNLSLPKLMKHDEMSYGDSCFSSLAEVFCNTRDTSSAADVYLSYISQKLSEFSLSNNSEHIAALIIEPVIHGAGGMHMIDPLFQRILVNECKNRKIPVIFDEVFTGFWRLGVQSASELLGCLPDIACYAKLMTGGIVPLAATLATEEIFESFKSDSKLTALLHGHSYTAHAMGCCAAVKAIQWYQDPSSNSNLDFDHMRLKELWDCALVQQLSSLPNVERVVSIGTVCVVELKTQGSDAGYASLYARSLIEQLRKDDDIYVRPLGNVIYLMCGPCTARDSCTQQLSKLHCRLCGFN
ncbi:hypothetical protein PR202_gb25686 [Eleusine coracana subsp. coracana]|uniref:Uncharacterized protein n=1 Tax=Eleusine coracana subsp. coracana TaxID=191504 RepID=A0AAV5FQL8_ELECO|nr:hypothetical protein PR202_gb25686 [Eleusine coracana subsp. coracana]